MGGDVGFESAPDTGSAFWLDLRVHTQPVERRFPRRQGEYYALLLSSVVGMLILPGARDVLLLVVAFELMGIPLYVLAAYAKSEGMPLLASEEPGSGKKSPAAEAAIKLYDKALETDPKFADAHFNLAMAHEALGDRTRAKRHWKRYLELDPEGTWADVAREHLK